MAAIAPRPGSGKVAQGLPTCPPIPRRLPPAPVGPEGNRPRCRRLGPREDACKTSPGMVGLRRVSCALRVTASRRVFTKVCRNTCGGTGVAMPARFATRVTIRSI